MLPTLVLAVTTAMAYSFGYQSPHPDHYWNHHDSPPSFQYPQNEYTINSGVEPFASSQQPFRNLHSDHDPRSPLPPSSFYSSMLRRSLPKPQHFQYSLQQDRTPLDPFSSRQSSSQFLAPLHPEDSTASSSEHKHADHEDLHKYSPRPFQSSDRSNQYLLHQRPIERPVSLSEKLLSTGLHDSQTFDHSYSRVPHSYHDESAYSDGPRFNERSFGSTRFSEYPPNAEQKHKHYTATDGSLHGNADKAEDVDFVSYHPDPSSTFVSKPEKLNEHLNTENVAHESSLNNVPPYILSQLLEDLRVHARKEDKFSSDSEDLEQDMDENVDHRRSDKKDGPRVDDTHKPYYSHSNKHEQFSRHEYENSERPWSKNSIVKDVEFKEDEIEHNSSYRHGEEKGTVPGYKDFTSDHMRGEYDRSIPRFVDQMHPLNVDQPEAHLLKEDWLYDTLGQSMQQKTPVDIRREHWSPHLQDADSQKSREDSKHHPKFGSHEWPNKIFGEPSDQDGRDDYTSAETQYGKLNSKIRHLGYDGDFYTSKGEQIFGNKGQFEIENRKDGNHRGKYTEYAFPHEGLIQNKPSNMVNQFSDKNPVDIKKSSKHAKSEKIGAKGHTGFEKSKSNAENRTSQPSIDPLHGEDYFRDQKDHFLNNTREPSNRTLVDQTVKPDAGTPLWHEDLLNSTNYWIDQDASNKTESVDQDLLPEWKNQTKYESMGNLKNRDGRVHGKNSNDIRGISFHMQNRSDEWINHSKGTMNKWDKASGNSIAGLQGKGDSIINITKSKHNRSEHQAGQIGGFGVRGSSENEYNGVKQNGTTLLNETGVGTITLEDQLENGLKHGNKYYGKLLGEIKQRLDRVVTEAIEELEKQAKSESISHARTTKRELNSLRGSVSKHSNNSSASNTYLDNELKDEKLIASLQADIKKVLLYSNKTLAAEKAYPRHSKGSTESNELMRGFAADLKQFMAGYLDEHNRIHEVKASNASVDENSFESTDLSMNKSELLTQPFIGVNENNGSHQWTQSTGINEHSGSPLPQLENVHVYSASDRKTDKQNDTEPVPDSSHSHKKGHKADNRTDIGVENNGGKVLVGHSDKAFDKCGKTSSEQPDINTRQSSVKNKPGKGENEHGRSQDKTSDNRFKDIDIPFPQNGFKPTDHSDVSTDQSEVTDTSEQPDKAIGIPENYKLDYKSGLWNVVSESGHTANRPHDYLSYGLPGQDSPRKQVYEPRDVIKGDGVFDHWPGLVGSTESWPQSRSEHTLDYQHHDGHDDYSSQDYLLALGSKLVKENEITGPRNDRTISSDFFHLMGHGAFPHSSYRASDGSRHSSNFKDNYQSYNTDDKDDATYRQDYRGYESRSYDHPSYGQEFIGHNPSNEPYDHPDTKAYSASGFDVYEPYETRNNPQALKVRGHMWHDTRGIFEHDAADYGGPYYNGPARFHPKSSARSVYPDYGIGSLPHDYTRQGKAYSDRYAEYGGLYKPKLADYARYDPETFSQAWAYIPQNWVWNDGIGKLSSRDRDQLGYLNEDLHSVDDPEDRKVSSSEIFTLGSLLLVDMFTCPRWFYLSGMQSWVAEDGWGMSESGDVRHFNFSCLSLPNLGPGYRLVCQWADEKSKSRVYSFRCSDHAVMSGWKRSRPGARSGNYTMSYQCCDIFSPTGVSAYQVTRCQRTPYMNQGPEHFNFTVPDGTVLYGVHTVALNSTDRRYILEYCQLLLTDM